MPTPTVGRIVLVTTEPPHDTTGGDAAPAVITHVHSDISVNLRVLHDGPTTSWLTSVPLHDSRQALDEARARRVAAAPHLEGTWYTAAFWPPHTPAAPSRPRLGNI